MENLSLQNKHIFEQMMASLGEDNKNDTDITKTKIEVNENETTDQNMEVPIISQNLKEEEAVYNNVSVTTTNNNNDNSNNNATNNNNKPIVKLSFSRLQKMLCLLATFQMEIPYSSYVMKFNSCPILRWWIQMYKTKAMKILVWISESQDLAYISTDHFKILIEDRFKLQWSEFMTYCMKEANIDLYQQHKDNSDKVSSIASIQSAGMKCETITMSLEEANDIKMGLMSQILSENKNSAYQPPYVPNWLPPWKVVEKNKSNGNGNITPNLFHEKIKDKNEISSSSSSSSSLLNDFLGDGEDEETKTIPDLQIQEHGRIKKLLIQMYRTQQKPLLTWSQLEWSIDNPKDVTYYDTSLSGFTIEEQKDVVMTEREIKKKTFCFEDDAINYYDDKGEDSEKHKNKKNKIHHDIVKSDIASIPGVSDSINISHVGSSISDNEAKLIDSVIAVPNDVIAVPGNVVVTDAYRANAIVNKSSPSAFFCSSSPKAKVHKKPVHKKLVSSSSLFQSFRNNIYI